jgi:anthranilate synthase component 1
MFYLNFGQRKLVGASPELLVKLKDNKIYTCPIAGTRPRGKDAHEDQLLAQDLLQDTKELAEHAMLVDLARNDLGRISVPGTVTLERMMQVEMFSHVMHIVSDVAGDLDPDYSALDVLTACFPAGTVSGAPKVRAMEIIHELEQNVRGAYAGAVGYFDFRGNMDTCITIRTMVVEGDEVIIRTGAGIVADSVPEKEFQEVLNKAKVLFQLVAEGATS